MSGYPVAFVDEAFIHGRGHPGVYLFASIVVDSDDLPTVMGAARHAAGDHQPYHTTDLYKWGHLTPIENMLDAVQAHAGWAFLTAQIPIPGPQQGDREGARQAAFGRLLQQLNEQKVRDVVVDTRASQREQVQTQLAGRKISDSDIPDVTTYRNLVRSNQISSRVRLMHVDDRQQPGLWMADVVAWSLRRALAYDEPQWFSRISEVSTLVDAQTGRKLVLESDRAAPPSGERGPGHLSQSAQASLSTQQFYTLNGGTTNRSQGPGYLFADLIQQVEQPTVQQQLLRQVAVLNRSVQGLSAAIQQSAQQPMPAVRPHGQQPRLDQSEPEIAAPVVSELTID